MAHKKGQGSSKNGRDSNAQRRGVKRFGGENPAVGLIEGTDAGIWLFEVGQNTDALHV